MADLNNQLILVTGAKRGQRKAIAEHLANLGARVIISARNFNEAERVAKEIGKDKAYPVQLNVTNEAEWEAAIDEIIKQFNRLDVLVNNAGSFIRKPFTETTLHDYRQLINVNQIGVFLGMQLVIPQMIKQQQGSIINNVSISAFSPIHHSSVYAATKASVVAMSKAAAVELGPEGIRVNMIHPGEIQTEMIGENERSSADYDVIPLGRRGKPVEIAKTVA